MVSAIRAIVDDDSALMPWATGALRTYNLDQLHVVEHEDHKSVLSAAAILPGSAAPNGSDGKGERYIDAEGGRSFTYDHVNLIASDYKPYELPGEEGTFRKLLSESWNKYAKNHYPSGVASVQTSVAPLQAKDEPKVAAEAEPMDEDAATEEQPDPATLDRYPDPIMTLDQYPSGVIEKAPTPEDGGNNHVLDIGGIGGALEKLDAEMVTVEEEGAEPTVETREAPAESPKEEYPSGITEIEPTPVAQDLSGQEVDRDGGLEKLDEEMKEVKDESEEQREEEETEKELEVEEKREVADADLAQLQGATTDTEAAEQNLVGATSSEPSKPPTYTLEIVGNRYSPTNFWTGRWRTRWVVDTESSTVNGKINVDVHYYEQGNVQLNTSHEASFPVPEKEGAALSSAIVTTIAKIEMEYQLELGEVYADLGDRAFRS